MNIEQEEAKLFEKNKEKIDVDAFMCGMIEEGMWVVSQKEVHIYATENDGECVIAKAKYFTCGGDPYAVCVFTNPDEARLKGAVDWDWYFTDEPMIDERWKLDE